MDSPTSRERITILRGGPARRTARTVGGAGRPGCGAAGRAWGVGFGVTGSVVTIPATYGLPVSKGLYAWGGAASTDFWIDHQEELVGIIHTQLLPSGTYPTAQLMQLATYQAIVE